METSRYILKRLLNFYRFTIVAAIILSSGLIWAGDNGNQTPQETIDSYFTQVIQNIKDGENHDQTELDNQVITLVEKLFDVERLASQTLPKRWIKISRHEKKMFVKALQIAIKQKIMSHINTHNSQSLPSITFESVKNKKNVSTLNYLVSNGKDRTDISFYMLKYPDGVWRISNWKVGKNSLRRDFYTFCQKIIKKYSLPYLIAELTDSEYIVLEDFEGGLVGQLPPTDWLWKKSDNEKNKPYQIRIENGNKFLAAEDNGETVILAKSINWDLKKYPYISFKWRVHHVPEGGDERYGRSVDSAAGIYIIYKKKLGLIPESVKYVWSATLPVGAATQRSGIGRPWNIVAESGEEHMGEWRTYTFNAYEAYKKTFGGNPPDKPEGIGILSDANSTKSKAYADYDDIRALKQANADSGIKEKLKAE